ncbi:MAG: hypothetical protein MOB07_16225 [Acidobacteria bacterium]|nr:hypothetical protein [Acidobacteriota bacterium]
MPEPTPVILTQLVLWYDPARIQSWPAFLSKIPEGTALKSPTDFSRLFVTNRMTDNRHAAAEKMGRNLPGLESHKGRLILRGLGLIDVQENGYALTAEGRQLAQAYVDDPKGPDWVRYLARLLLTREPRTRVVMRYFSAAGAVLRFERASWFGGSFRMARIETDGETIAPFAPEDDEAPSLRSVLQLNAWWSLGAWRNHPLLTGTESCRFVGQFRDAFSLKDIGLALRCPFEALLQLGVIQKADGECWLDAAAATRELGADLAEEFGWKSDARSESFPELLDRLVSELRSDTGFIVASELRQALLKHGVENPDREIARLESRGGVVIEAEDFGQTRHGEGLFGEPRKQLVKLRVEAGSGSKQ